MPSCSVSKLWRCQFAMGPLCWTTDVLWNFADNTEWRHYWEIMRLLEQVIALQMLHQLISLQV